MINVEKHLDKYYQLALNISYYRKKKGLSQIELAEKANISRTHLSKIEAPNVLQAFSLNILFEIAEALEIEPMKLFDFTK